MHSVYANVMRPRMSQQAAIRITHEMRRLIDEHKRLLASLYPDTRITVADAVRDLIERGSAIATSDGDGRTLVLRETNERARMGR